MRRTGAAQTRSGAWRAVLLVARDNLGAAPDLWVRNRGSPGPALGEDPSVSATASAWMRAVPISSECFQLSRDRTMTKTLGAFNDEIEQSPHGLVSVIG